MIRMVWIAAIASLSLGFWGMNAALAEPAHEVVKRANLLRAEQGLAPLRISPVLQRAAERHGRDMVQKGFFSHRGSDGSNTGTRARREGYRYCWIAENIARGQRSGAEVMRSWAGSRAHRHNILNPRATEIGVIRQSGNFWVMVLGTPRGSC